MYAASTSTMYIYDHLNSFIVIAFLKRSANVSGLLRHSCAMFHEIFVGRCLCTMCVCLVDRRPARNMIMCRTYSRQTHVMGEN